MQTRRYTFKLYPNAEQRRALGEQAKLCAMLWNAALEQREIQWAHECQRHPKSERKGLSLYDQTRELKDLRAQDEAYRAMSADTAARVLAGLDLAFKAFFKRAKNGAGASSGYPKFKSLRHADSIPYRDAPKGWKLHAHGNAWKIYAKGIPGTITARGKFPVAPDEIRTMDLMFRDGSWWASIVVKIPERRAPGASPIAITFDLIDEFARVELADGGRPSADFSDTEIGNHLCIHRRSKASGAGTIEMLGDDGEAAPACRVGLGAGTLKMRGDDGAGRQTSRAIRGAGTLEMRKDTSVIDTMKSARDTRRKRGSIRWHRDKERIARASAKAARKRREDLHKWTTGIISQASALDVTHPPVKEITSTGKGDARRWGAAVKTVAMVNRAVLEQAPAAAIDMLRYKAAEAGIEFSANIAETPKAAIGKDIAAVKKIERKAARKLKKEN